MATREWRARVSSVEKSRTSDMLSSLEGVVGEVLGLKEVLV